MRFSELYKLSGEKIDYIAQFIGNVIDDINDLGIEDSDSSSIRNLRKTAESFLKQYAENSPQIIDRKTLQPYVKITGNMNKYFSNGILSGNHGCIQIKPFKISAKTQKELDEIKAEADNNKTIEKLDEEKTKEEEEKAASKELKRANYKKSKYAFPVACLKQHYPILYLQIMHSLNRDKTAAKKFKKFDFENDLNIIENLRSPYEVLRNRYIEIKKECEKNGGDISYEAYYGKFSKPLKGINSLYHESIQPIIEPINQDIDSFIQELYTGFRYGSAWEILYFKDEVAADNFTNNYVLDHSYIASKLSKWHPICKTDAIVDMIKYADERSLKDLGLNIIEYEPTKYYKDGSVPTFQESSFINAENAKGLVKSIKNSDLPQYILDLFAKKKYFSLDEKEETKEKVA